MMHQAEAILNAHLRDPSSTVASVGVCYALCIGARPQFSPAEWLRIHDAIRARFNPKDHAAWLKLRNRINGAGWRLVGAVIQGDENG
ncbi:hypothetical protein SAMN05421774_10841 [Gemmobacter megaterium]|uniref:Uncharacterized protein n=1 Tax=Gemmobacter megaterium TaxID=1086013 RepID=A0A1N7QAF7_9RHOB|nr:hypothetical protein [Gemmobacter megaterium]GGE24503.1 hypothetical protein GCM10011345_33090 [Gemmobacter megaterium]SIT19835.1 hypothetical protein SAMN05421774_10841 [Gemmobacter megaterium]